MSGCGILVTWLRDGFGRAGLDALKGLFQPKSVYDSVLGTNWRWGEEKAKSEI